MLFKVLNNNKFVQYISICLDMNNPKINVSEIICSALLKSNIPHAKAINKCDINWYSWKAAPIHVECRISIFHALNVYEIPSVHRQKEIDEYNNKNTWGKNTWGNTWSYSNPEYIINDTGNYVISAIGTTATTTTSSWTVHNQGTIRLTANEYIGVADMRPTAVLQEIEQAPVAAQDP